MLQPIDTIPIDGTIVLVTDGDRWSDANQPPGYLVGRWRYHNGIGKWVGGSLQFTPTHWIPIPGLLPNAKVSCHWYADGESYETGCGNAFEFNNDGPNENGFNFCPYCGKPLSS